MKRIITLLIAIVGALSALMAADTQLFLVGGFSGWGFLPENELSTTDGDYYVATYPKGSEIVLSGDFKLADPSWGILNYGGNLQVEAGKSYTLQEKVNTNLNAVGKIKITKIEFTVSTATLKIIGTTEENLFDLTTDQGVSLVELTTTETFNRLSFQGNGVYTGTYTVPSGDFWLKVGGDGNFNTIDFGTNGEFMFVGTPYLLTKGAFVYVTVVNYEDWNAGDVYDVKVTFTADWTATLLLTKKAVTPDPEPVVTITDLKVNSFSHIEAGKTTTTTATYTITNAANANATISGTHASYFKIISQSVNGTNGSVQIQFAPTTEGKYNAKLTITSGTATASVAISGIALAPKEEVTITNLQIGKFSNTEVGETSTATATFTLSGATSATASLSGADAAYFKILSQNVSNGNGTVVVEFTPNVGRKYNATLNITADDVSESVQFSAMGILPQLPAEINDLKVSSFAVTNLGLSTTSTATYKLVNATSATASLGGADANYFKILSQDVSNGDGTVVIEFTPTQARKYNAALTILAGSVSESIAFSAIGQEPVIIISNLQTPKFTDAEEDKTSVAWIGYDLEGATSATATLSGADAIYFKILDQTVSDGHGIVGIEFTPNIPRKYNATLTITAGKESESVSFNAIAAAAPVAPAIKYLKVEEFDRVRPNVSCTSFITYQLEDAYLSDISISGRDAEFFTLKKSGSDYYIVFTPLAAGDYLATLTLTTTNGLSASLDFAAACEDETYTPVLDPVVTISNLKVPAFEDTQVGKTSFVTATFKVQGTTCATAALSGTNAGSFKIMSQSVTDGKGEVKIKFVPNKEGVYNATLTVSAGNENVITNITAKTTTVQPEPEPGPGDDPSDDPDPEPGPGDDPSDDPDPEPGPGEDPTPDPEPEPDPSPYAEYPLIGYFYWVNIGIEYEPDLEWVKTDNSYEFNLEEIESYQPVWNSRIDVDLVPEKLEKQIYGLDIYKFEVRDKEKISYVREGGYSRSFEFEDVDITKTPYYANGVWYESIEEMMTWYVNYIPSWDDDVSKVMVEESPGVFVATFDAAADTDDDDYYYYCLGNVEDPILVVGIGEYSWNIQNYLQIAQGFKAMIYLEEENWNTYYKLVPPGDAWDKPYIDLGLPSGLCWAVKNLGADKPEDEGHHYAWGEVEPKEDYSYETYKWANQLKNYEFIKYVTDDYYGLIDFRNTLEPNDDAANVALGSKWHIPSKLATQELLKECTTEFGYYYGVKGYFITGPNGNAIFLPGAEEWEDTDFNERGNGGNYWTSTLYDSNNGTANKLVFALTYIDSDDDDYAARSDGLVIRPVIHRDYVAIDEVPAIDVYAKEGTIYSELDFEIYNLTGINVTHLNGSLEGIYIVKTNEGNRLISVW